MGKYDPLTDFLRRQLGNRVQISFEQMEDADIIGIVLPRSAKERREWWGNETSAQTRHKQCLSWLQAGYQVETVDLSEEFVVFVRT